MSGFFTHNWGLKLFSLLLAVMIWWLIRQEREREENAPYSRTPRHEIPIAK
jgi:hypothetical protein